MEKNRKKHTLADRLKVYKKRFNRLDKNFFDYIKLNNSVFTDWQAMQTCTCLRFWRVFYPPKRLLRDSPQAPKIVPFGDGCTSCGR